MARSNKYAAINFNEIYGPQKPSNSPSAHLSSTSFSSARTHGRMIILTRPTNPKPNPIPTPKSSPLFTSATPSPPTTTTITAATQIEPDSISLRPLGRTPDPPIKPSQPAPALSTATKPEPFVPPHLRPGFAGRLDPDPHPGPLRPRSAGHQHDTMRRPGSDLGRSRPWSGGTRPSSTAWNGHASHRSPPS